MRMRCVLHHLQLFGNVVKHEPPLSSLKINLIVTALRNEKKITADLNRRDAMAFG